MLYLSYGDDMNKDYSSVISYLKEHINDYTEKEASFIALNYDKYKDNDYIPDILRQIYDELSLLKDEDNIYLGFINLIDEYFNIDSNIIEVGGGVIPTLSKHIHLRQRKGTITVYDPKVNFSNTSPNYKIIKDKFTEETDIKACDLIIGLMPCEATEIILKTAFNNNKDFLIALCDGNHNELVEYFDYEDWQNKIIDKAKSYALESSLGKVYLTDLKKYKDPYPVIYNKRK